MGSNWLAVENGSSGSGTGPTTPAPAQVCVYEAATVAAAVAAAAAAEQRGVEIGDRGARGEALGAPSAHLLTAITRERSSSSPNVCHHINPIQNSAYPNLSPWAIPVKV